MNSPYDTRTVELPRSKAEQARLMNSAWSSGYDAGHRAATLRAEQEHKQWLTTNRNAAIGQAVELLQEASKMMSRAGYLVDKANGVRP